MRRASIQDVEAHNYAMTLRVLRSQGPMSQTQIAASLGLSPAAVSRIVQRLTSAKLIIEGGKVNGKIGRRATLLRVSSTGAQLLAVLIKHQDVKMALLDLHNQILCSRDLPLGVRVDPDEVVSRVRRECLTMLAELEVDPSRLVGAGVAFGGMVDPTSGVAVGLDVQAGWADVPLRSKLESALGIPVVVDHAVRIRAWAEHIRGAARGCRNVFHVMGGQLGVGAALILDGKLHRGASSSAGEFGHTIVVPGGRPCRCGNRGCLEAHVSGAAILEAVRAGLEAGAHSVLAPRAEGLTISDVHAAAAQGDRLAQVTLREAARYLAQAIISGVWLLDPKIIVLGGPLFVDCPYLVEATRATLGEYKLIRNRQAVPVVLSVLTDADALTGVADLAASRYISSLAGVFAGAQAV